MTNSLQIPLAFAFVVIVAFSGVFLLSKLYDYRAESRLPHRLRELAKLWAFSPAETGAAGWWQFCLASFLSLFLEMLMIRWIASEVSVFAYFKNVVLIACFFGFGLGCYFSRRSVNLLAFLIPVCLLVVLIKLPWPALRSVIQQIPYYITQTSQIDLLGGPNPAGPFSFFAAILLIVCWFALVAFTFVPLGQLIGWFLETTTDGILAYTANVLASLAGILLYTLLCFLYQPPAVWFACSGVITTALLWKIPRFRWTSAAAFLLCVLVVSLGPPSPSRELWSPYQKITLTPVPGEHDPYAYELMTNDNWYQKIFNLSPEFVAKHPEFFRAVPVEWNAYNIPYHFYARPRSVLILGAGTGNDVAAAVRNGAEHVIAVEIDPLILDLGRQLHFEKPYASPRVETVLDDARSYIQNSRAKFDLILFSLLDSHTTSSSYSNIRIDNYVYTLESLQAARRLLQPDGVFIIKFWVTTPWIAGRLLNLVRTAFDQSPADLNALSSDYTTPGRFFVAGSEERIHQAMSDAALRSYITDNRTPRTSAVAVTTDDWPYFYQRARGIPPSLIVLSLVLVAFCAGLLRRTGTGLNSLRWHFFFLGAGFMLLEAQIVSKMALLFGTTWLVNSVVVGGLMILIVMANFLITKFPRFPYPAAYLGIFLALSIAYLIPLQKFFFASLWLKALSATLVLCLPVFFAGTIFVRSFSQAGFSAEALGSNLFGALLGGLMESLSFWTGIRSLLLLAAALYVASGLSLRHTWFSRRPE